MNAGNAIRSNTRILPLLLLLWSIASTGNLPAQGDDGDVITAGGGTGAMIRSTDGGRTWFVVGDEVAADARRRMARSLARTGDAATLDVGSVGGMLRVTFTLEQPGDVLIQLIDMSGRVLAMQHEGTLPMGRHTAAMQVYGVPPGCYYCGMLCAGRISGTRILIE